ncbi:MAG: DedA family protein [Pseudomonadota bacterium]
MIELGSIEAMTRAALAFIAENSAFVPVLVFFLGLGESIVIVSLFIPSTALFLAIGAADSAAGGTFLPVWLAGSAGAMLGDVISFAVGRYFREDLVRFWPFSRYPDLFDRCRGLFQRWGLLAIMAGKFMGTARPFLPVVAGAMTMPWPQFVFASFASSLAWAGLLLAPGYGLAALWS